MFNSFGSAPKIMRWFCRGRVVEVVDEGEKGWEEWREARGWFDGEITSGRAVIVLDVWKCQVSCGFGVPVSGLGGKGGEGEEEGEGKERGKGDVERLEAFSVSASLFAFFCFLPREIESVWRAWRWALFFFLSLDLLAVWQLWW